MTARAVVERMMAACEAASENPSWCRVHESRIRFRVNPHKGGASDCDSFRDALDIAEETQEKMLTGLRAKVQGLTHDGLTATQSATVLKREVLALIDGALISGELERTAMRELKAHVVALADEATAMGELQRRPGEAPDAFYGRVARAHMALSRITDKPTSELAKRAGVSKGTAGAWVSRARARGLLAVDQHNPHEGEPAPGVGGAAGRV